MPGDEVHKGVLRSLGSRSPPYWMEPLTVPYATADRVFVQVPNGEHFIASLWPFVYNRNDNVHGYHCYIKTSANTFLVADLVPYRDEDFPNDRTRVFVRLPIHNDPILTGLLRPLNGASPAYLRRSVENFQ